MLEPMNPLIFGLLSILFLLPGASPAASAAELADSARQFQAQGLSHLSSYQYEQALRQSPRDEALLRAEAGALAGNGYPGLARARWQQLLALHPGDPEATQALSAAEAPVVPPETVASTVAALEVGQGVWVNGDVSARVKRINAFNISAPRAQRLRHVFVAGGGIRIAQGRAQLSLDLRPSRIAGAGLAGEAQAHLWLSLSTRGAGGVAPSEWERLAGALAAALKDERRISGLHLSPDTASAALYPFYAALRKQLSIPISVLLLTLRPDDLGQVDLVVLRAWSKGMDPAAYALRVRDQVSRALRVAGAAQQKLMIGLPVRGAQGLAQLQAGREAISASLGVDEPGPLGIALMGLVDDDSGASADWDPGVWDLAKLPVAGP